MRALLIGDVGVQSGAMHAGDEAMLAEALRLLRERGLESAVVVSADPEGTAARYDVDAVSPIGFPGSRHDDDAPREERLAAVVATASGEMGRLAADDPARAVIRAIAQSDVVVVAGAGNLSSLWPDHVYERSAIGHVATVLGTPVVVSGQTLGPTILPSHGERISQLVQQSTLFGVREAASAAIAERIGVAATRTYDDALAIGLGVDVAPLDLPARFASATVAPATGRWPAQRVVDGIAALLDGIVERHDLDVVLVPHVAPVDGGVDHDARMHARIVERMRHASRALSLGAVEPEVAAAIAGAAALTVSTRYHPVVFALAAGRPAVGIATDEYTDAKIGGALENHGLGALCIPVLALATGDADRVVDAALRVAEPVLRRAADAAVAGLATWWDAVAALAEPPAIAFSPASPILEADLAARLAAVSGWQRDQSLELTLPVLLATERSVVERAHAAEVADLRAQLGEVQAARIDAGLRAREHEQALEAAHERIGELAEPVIERMWRETRSRRHLPGDELLYAQAQRDEAVAHRDAALARLEVMEAELAGLLQTRLMRWTRGARSRYRDLRGR